MKKAVSLLSLNTPNSNWKRRRLRDTLAQFTKETEISPFPPPRKRPSTEHCLSNGSLLDISNTPEACKALAGQRTQPLGVLHLFACSQQAAPSRTITFIQKIRNMTPPHDSLGTVTKKGAQGQREKDKQGNKERKLPHHCLLSTP